MRKLVSILTFALIGVMMTAGAGVQAQVNMSRYITLTVQSGEAIKLDLKASSNNTPVRIVSGSNTQDITVGTSWTGVQNYTSDGTTMTVYGDVTRFECSGNDAKLTSLDVNNNTALINLSCYRNSLTSLDVSGCTALTYLYCYDNNFSTADLDAIYCALPDRNGEEEGEIQPVFNASSTNYATVLATTKGNATNKNWKVQYFVNNTDIPPTTGSFDCNSLGIEETRHSPTVSLYPNPVENVLYIKSEDEVRSIHIYKCIWHRSGLHYQQLRDKDGSSAGRRLCGTGRNRPRHRYATGSEEVGGIRNYQLRITV